MQPFHKGPDLVGMAKRCAQCMRGPSFNEPAFLCREPEPFAMASPKIAEHPSSRSLMVLIDVSPPASLLQFAFKRLPHRP